MRGIRNLMKSNGWVYIPERHVYEKLIKDSHKGEMIFAYMELRGHEVHVSPKALNELLNYSETNLQRILGEQREHMDSFV